MDGRQEIRDACARAEIIPPMDPPADSGGGDDREIPPGETYQEPPEAEGAQFPLNDYGNGQRLLTYFGRDILFVPRLGWFRWQGERWLADEDELKVRADAQKIAGRILSEIEFLALEDWERDAIELGRELTGELRDLEKMPRDQVSDEDRKRLRELREIVGRADDIKERFGKRKSAHRSHARNSGNSGKISNMMVEARTAVACGINDLNSDPLALNVANGTIRFQLDLDPHSEAWGRRDPDWRLQLDPHDRADMISKLVPVAYHKGAKCRLWREFLDRVQPDPAMQRFLQRWAGYCLTGKTTEQKLVFHFGGGRNGKSTFTDTIAKILSDYGTTVPIETLTGSEQRKGSDATPDLVRLPGARFVRASEPERGTRMKEAMIKALTGGEAIMIRRMMQEFVEVEPEFKLNISGNHKPEIRGGDDGIWRRVLLVPWQEQIAECDVDAGLPEKLWAEREGILAWMVEGCLDWLRTGLQIPASIREATEEYREASDPIRLFLKTECEITGASDDWLRARDLTDAFLGWMIETEQGAWGTRTVANHFKERANGGFKGPDGQQFTPAKRSDTGYIGIRLKEDAWDRIAKYGEQIRAAAARKG
ncbi:phage/plasmid primase, P4 family [Salipiger sp.]|uniref:phage/plasmid primase, P4 family n=1 Tax=Salipiger sp. TaxID=2078585 RepID=UPI003A98270F